MLKKSQIPSLVSIIVNTLLMVLVLALADLSELKGGIFESFLLIFVYIFWMLVIGAVNLLIAGVLFLFKQKEPAFAFVVGAVYISTAGPIAIFAYTYIKLKMM